MSFDQLTRAAKTTTIRIHARGADGGVSVRECSSAEFEPDQHGVQARTTTIPWERVERYDTVTREPVDAMPEGEHVRQRVRLVLDDGTTTGQTIEMPADKFSVTPQTVVVSEPVVIDAEAGVAILEKRHYPWRRVIEFERLLAAPARPDADDL